jgi:hypothetical protein
LKGLEMEMVSFGIYRGLLVCFIAIWDIIDIFLQFWYIAPRKIWQPWPDFIVGREAEPDFFVLHLFSLEYGSPVPGFPEGIFAYHKLQFRYAYFGGVWSGKCWHVLCQFEIFYDHLVYFMAI